MVGSGGTIPSGRKGGSIGGSGQGRGKRGRKGKRSSSRMRRAGTEYMGYNIAH